MNWLPEGVNPLYPRELQCSAMEEISAHDRLVSVVGRLYADNRGMLESSKANLKSFERPDFIWRYFLLSMATWGSASGAKRFVHDPDSYRLVAWETLAALTPSQRQAQVMNACISAGLRYPSRKADCILKCFDLIAQMGGPEAAKALLCDENGCEAKIKFLQRMPGIGPKYARNMMMDVYHPEFRECIAVDTRIKAISKALGLSFSTYKEHEDFYLAVAHSAGLEGWELDRLLFALRDAVESRLARA